jgi:transcription termination factor NusA
MDTLDLDEFFAQLLVSEGFTNLEEVAYVEIDELLVIDGVDEDTANELAGAGARHPRGAGQGSAGKGPRAGGRGQPIEFRGADTPDGQALAEDGVKTLEDFATCADWELAGGWTTVDGERVKDDGLLEPFDVSLEEAQNMVMTARIMLGWVDPADLEAEEDAKRQKRCCGRGGDRGLIAQASLGARWVARRPHKGSGKTAPNASALPRVRCSPKGLMRFVIGPESQVVPDIWGQAARARHLRRGRGGAGPGGQENPVRPRRKGTGHCARRA